MDVIFSLLGLWPAKFTFRDGKSIFESLSKTMAYISVLAGGKRGLGTNDHLFAVIESYLKVPSEVSAQNGLRA